MVHHNVWGYALTSPLLSSPLLWSAIAQLQQQLAELQQAAEESNASLDRERQELAAAGQKAIEVCAGMKGGRERDNLLCCGMMGVEFIWIFREGFLFLKQNLG